ncbi:MAG: carboxypeptidase-like regulatory domain-containing protein [Gilvibacter sp.]
MKKILLLLLLSALFAGDLQAQEATKNVALVYDVSYSMKAKDMTKEIGFLDSYFNQNPNVKLALKTFSNTVILESNFYIENGNWDDLMQELMATIYDGGSSFTDILPNNTDEIVFITDGKSVNDDLPKTFSVPVNIISLTKEANDNQLRDLALSSGGVFFNLNNLNEFEAKETSETFTITGVVTDNIGPLANANVYASDTDQKTITDAKGAYTIVGKRGGTIEFSFVGKNTVMTSVPVSGIKNVQLRDSNELLDEVVVSASVEDEVELINTGNQMVDRKRLGYGIETISDEAITEQDITMEQAIRGQFSNLDLPIDRDLRSFLSRGKGMSINLDQTGLIIIDGIPINSSPFMGDQISVNASEINPSNQGIGAMDPANIASITFLKGLAATNKYGTLGRNGVILITTKTGLGAKAADKKEIVLGTTATYDGDAAKAASLPDTPYIKALQASKTIDEAYEVYLAQRDTYGNDATFFIDAAAYFKNWNNAYMLERILSNVNEVSASLEDLRALAYAYQEAGLNAQAVTAYERIKNINPSQAQAHRNLALAYVQNGQLEEALAIYKAFDAKTIPQVADFGTLRKTMVNEYKNLLAQHKGKINTAGLNDFYLNNITYATRVIFEWSDFDAMFDLQIVNPQKRYFTWSHTPQAEAVRMRQEQALGYGLEEFFMTSSDTGDWLFNLTYFGKNGGDTQKPTYIKVTTIHNFGKSNQSEKVEVISLLDEGNSQTVLSLNLK